MKKSLKLFALLAVAMLLVASCYNPWGNLPPWAIPGIVPDGDQDTGDEPEPGTVSKEEPIKIVGDSATISLEASPAGDGSESNSTTVSIPESVVSSAKRVKLTVTPYDIENASFIISDSDFVVGAINISMELDSRKASEFSEPVTITTYIAQGLDNVNVKYDGSGAAPTLVRYDDTTGEVVFTTTHFSIFYIVSDPVDAYISGNNTAYATLADAIAEAPTGSSITLLRDTRGKGLGSDDGTTQVRESLIIDFAGHTYTMMDPAVGSTGTETQAMHWGKSLGSITMKNGTFRVAEEDIESVKMAMQNYIDFIADSMTFDFSNVPVVSYEDNEFTGKYEEYNGLEVPMFNNNKGKMYLNGCKVIMPALSTKGVSAGGEFVKLENTIIHGYVNLQSDNDKLIMIGSSDCDDVVSYFDGGRVISSVSDDGMKIYQLATE